MGMAVPGLGATFRRPAAFVVLHAAGFLGATAAEAAGGDAAGLGDDAPGRNWGSSSKNRGNMEVEPGEILVLFEGNGEITRDSVNEFFKVRTHDMW